MDKNEADNPLLNGSSSFDEILLNYDYHIDEAHKTNVIQSIYVSFKLLVGISIIALPNSFTNSGLIGGVIGVWMIGIINLITVLLQDSVSVKINKNITSYSMLGLAVFGYKGKIVIEILRSFI